MLQCPACKDYDIHLSRWSNVIERTLLSVILRQPVRCYSCFHRFHASIYAVVKPRGLRSSRNREMLALTAVEKWEENRQDAIAASAKAS